MALPPELVKADVVDIRSRSAPLPDIVSVDANILAFVFHDYSELVSKGGRGPQWYQVKYYTGWWKRAESSSTTFFTADVNLVEFITVLDRTELELAKLEGRQTVNPGRGDSSSRDIKQDRYRLNAILGELRESTRAEYRSVRRRIQVLPRPFGDPDAILESVAMDWIGSTADFNDAILVNFSKAASIPRIISDDADFATFEGITLYTANRNVVEAARHANRLTE